MNEEKNKGGRPTDYSPELAAEIHDLIASTPCGIRTLCKKNPQIPSHDTIYKWISKHTEFAELYAKAKVLQANLLVDEMLDIADDSSDDALIGPDGQPRLNREFYQRGRLRIDTRKFLASKLLPKLYGDKITAEITGTNGEPIKYQRISEEERKTIDAQLAAFITKT